MAIWYVWLVCAALNLVDLAVRGHDRTSAVLAAVVVLATGVAYVTALRPRIMADDDAVTLRNPFRDIRVPWTAVTGIDLRDIVRVHCRVVATADAPARERVLRSWALQSTYRGRLRAHRRAQAEAAERASRTAGYARVPPPAPMSARARAQALAPLPAADRAVARLNELRDSARERGAADGPPAVTWSRVSLVALAAPALLLAALILIP